MKAEEIDAKLAEIAEGRAAPAVAAPKPRPPLEALMRDALTLAKSAPSAEEDGPVERRAEAVRILERLPDFLRPRDASELTRRVTDVRLLDRSRAWRVGDRGLVFAGPTGIGKSSAAAHLFRRLLGVGWRSGGAAWEFARGLRWFSAAKLSQARREHPLGHGEAPELVRATWATLLFVDDAGWDRDPLGFSEVMAARYERGVPTVVTTGLTLDELERHYEAPVTRRITESGGGAATLVDCFAPASGTGGRAA
jgi:hypothetical protein